MAHTRKNALGGEEGHTHTCIKLPKLYVGARPHREVKKASRKLPKLYVGASTEGLRER